MQFRGGSEGNKAFLFLYCKCRTGAKQLSFQCRS